MRGRNMNKEEILAASRYENRGMDEREQKISFNAQIFAGMIVTLVALLFAILYFIKGQNLYCPTAIIFTNLAAISIYQYKYMKKKVSLLIGILAVFIVVMNIILFVWKG